MKLVFCSRTDTENTPVDALYLILGTKCQLEYPEENKENDTGPRNTT